MIVSALMALVILIVGSWPADAQTVRQVRTQAVPVLPAPKPLSKRERRRIALNRMQPQYIRWNFTGWWPIRLEKRRDDETR